jgi:predicted permease
VATTTLIEVVARMVLLVGVGVALRVSGLLKREDARVLNRVLVYAGIPALVFQAVHPAKLELALAGEALVGWCAIAGAMAVAWFAGRAQRLDGPRFGATLLTSSFANSGYIGYPVVLGIFGATGLARAVFFDVFATVLGILTVGIWIAARYGDHEHGTVSPLREIVTFPVVIALAAALLLKPFPMPDVLSQGLDALANLAVPLIMISVGLSLDLSKVPGHLARIAPIAGAKLVVAPLVAWLVAVFVLRDPDAVRVAVLEAAMPSAMLSLVIGERFGLDTDLIASAIAVTTVAALVTLPLVSLALR